MLMDDKLESTILSQPEKDRLQDDEELLLFAIELLKQQLFRHLLATGRTARYAEGNANHVEAYRIRL